MPFTASDICKIILAIVLPPLGVFLERGCNADFFINILLTILGYIPGIIHALYVQAHHANLTGTRRVLANTSNSYIILKY
ncbi:plasma membrane proteolipid 3 [Cladophialophora carrionii CBS 160.54]|uniref:Plasma membrane proteolipid 3 n=1 Tax=Cladophialophora carrionii CBS 160.54 TaxID=1279043 RepID=V9D108_9EURO|nr:plasma membrane proteolipid 3 [Cladophialophora carrionii CBS 160.54]ETI20570.1 plasma membrane proteolipid 3 [Cladophialophora carrionii CBS 160.54]